VPGRAPGTPGRPRRDRLRRRAGGDYDRSDLAHDVGAGLLLTALLIPAGMGYATAAGLPPETGLYATVASLVAYALVGPSRVLVLGPDSSLAPLIAAASRPSPPPARSARTGGWRWPACWPCSWAPCWSPAVWLGSGSCRSCCPSRSGSAT